MIESYAVFEGGGVKGTAFAGALRAAEESSIKFVGYGGASAGAMVAFLAALGCTSEEIKDKMSSIDFIKMLDGPVQGEAAFIKSEIKSELERLKQQPHSTCCFFKILLYWFVRKKNRTILWGILKRIWGNRGAYRKRNIISLLAYFAYEKIPQEISINTDTEELTISFRKFFKLTQVDFRVIATDVITGEAIEYSHDLTPNHCVFEAVAASSAYPLVFEPTDIKSRSLVDGGLSCNLPTYLFHGKEHKSYSQIESLLGCSRHTISKVSKSIKQQLR